jgi:hypothetical protein
MKHTDISYIKQKLLNLSKQDLIDFANYNKTWIRPYWPKSEIADAIISDQSTKTIPQLKKWAKYIGKESIIFSPEADAFWKHTDADEDEKGKEDKKTFSEEFLERWKKVTDKDEKPRPAEVRMPPRITPAVKEALEKKQPDLPVKAEIERIREKIKQRMGDRPRVPPSPPKPPGPPVPPPTLKEQIPVRPPPSLKDRIPVRPPPKFETHKVSAPEVKTQRYKPFRTQLEQLKERISKRVAEKEDQDLKLKDELMKETEELDKFMQKELEDKGIKFEEKEPEAPEISRKPEIDKQALRKEFGKRLFELEKKLTVHEIKPELPKRVPRKVEVQKPRLRVAGEPGGVPGTRVDELRAAAVMEDAGKKEEIELRAKFFDKYIKRLLSVEESLKFEPTPPIEPPVSRSREVLGGRINGRGLINGLAAPKGLVNGYSNGLVNGRINGKGMINGVARGRAREEDDMSRRLRRIGLIRSRFRKRIIVTGIVIFILFTLPVLLFMVPVPDGEGISIDGKFNDWDNPQIISYIDSPDDQLTNENINLIEYTMISDDNTLSSYLKVSGEAMAGRDLGTGFGLDTARIFIDYDAQNNTGYYIRDIGADFMFEITGYGNQINSAEVFIYEPYDISRSNQIDWNGWKLYSKIEADIGLNEIESQFWFPPNSINSSETIYSLFIMEDSSGQKDIGDSVISNLKSGSLSVIQSRLDVDILQYGWVDVLELEFTAYGTHVTVNNLDIDFHYSGDLIGLPSKLELEPEETQYITLQLNTRNIIQGSSIEIGFTDKSQVDSSADIVTLTGVPAKYFIEQAPQQIEIDGAFGDWNSVDSYTDIDAETVVNDNINISTNKFSYDSEEAYFYYEVEGSMLGGSMVPAGSYFLYPGDPEDLIDSDGDGVPDIDDPHPNNATDTDGDTLPDDYETEVIHTNHTNIDTDGDGWMDHVDLAPLDPDIPRFIPEIVPPPLLQGKDVARIFIDTDQNTNTGFKFLQEDMGADYMVEITGKYQHILERSLFRFEGFDKFGWNWSLIGTPDAAIDIHRMESAVKLSDINLKPGDGFKLYYFMTDWSAHSDKSNGTINYEPTGTLRITSEDISPGTRVRNRDIVGMLKLTFLADDLNTRVYSIGTTFMGNFRLSDLTNIIIFDDDGDGIFTNEDPELSRAPVGQTRNNQIDLKLDNELEFIPNVNRSVFLAIETNTTVNAGDTIGIEIPTPDDIGTNARFIIGNFPLSSNLFILENTSSRAPKKHVFLNLATTYTGPASATQGDSNILILSFTMTASNGDATINSLTIDHLGTGPQSDITAVYLSGPMGSLSGTFGTFTFTPFTITDGTSVSIDVYVDLSITAEAGKTHGVKVSGVGATNQIRIKGQAKSSGRMDVLLIPEFPDPLIPIGFMTVIFVSYYYKSKKSGKKIIHRVY